MTTSHIHSQMELTMTPLNVTGKEFCQALGVAFDRGVLREFRALNLVRFFKVGVKYRYSYADIEKVNDMLHNGEISIKTDKGIYYVTLNK